MNAWSWVAVALILLAAGIWLWHARVPRQQPRAETDTYVCSDCGDRHCSCQKQPGTTAREDRSRGGKGNG